ncbi:hypothetical protein [Streptomyces zaomyceticus]|uniref:hypothetical protein n=1 Tax=Streptomyces zaomyceticus TaxID=68286 RepID=UPI0016734511|nr:hypothetical protein [Streptomyces zaomyceticus]GHG28574.1 hypothetical protein GCM10018791_50990 [Streptomyces zaomyceticus]
MNHTNLWADHFGTAASVAIADQETFLAGRADLDERGIERFLISPGRISGLVTARNTGAELHAAITLPVLTSDQAANLGTATPQCGHHEADDAALPDCMAEPAHIGGVNLLPDPAQLSFACTCPATSACRHAAALAHAFLDRLRTHPGDLAVLRGLRQPSLPAQDIPAADTSAGTRTKTRLSAHHAWTWFRECTDLPSIPNYLPSLSNEPPSPAAWLPPPPPAPTSEHLHALVNDAATCATDFLRSGAPLECAWDTDAIRLASRIPHIRISDVADRLGLDIGELRDRITATRTSR